MEYQTIIRNGNEETIPAFVPKLEGDLAIVHLDVLQKLASMLPSASVSEVKRILINDIRESMQLGDVVDRCKEFVAFHETVNLITKYQPNEMADVNETDLSQDKADEDKHMSWS